MSEKKPNPLIFSGFVTWCALNSISNTDSTVKIPLCAACYCTCMKVNSHSKQRSRDWHESLAVVIWVERNSPDSLMDGVHQERIDA